MVELILKVLLDWKILLISLVFFLYATSLFMIKNKVKKVDKKKKAAEKELVIFEDASQLLEDVTPGKLYVPDSTYDMLVREKRIKSTK